MFYFFFTVGIWTTSQLGCCEGRGMRGDLGYEVDKVFKSSEVNRLASGDKFLQQMWPHPHPCDLVVGEDSSSPGSLPFPHLSFA